MPSRPEHRAIDPTADGVVDLRTPDTAGDLALRCVDCFPDHLETIPVRYTDDPTTVVRCAACGKKHSRDSLTVTDP